MALKRLPRKAAPVLALGFAAVVLSACDAGQAVYPDRRPGDSAPTWGDAPRETVFGPGGMDLFGTDRKKDPESGGGGGIGVNAFLWRAALDTIGFMPIASADPFGGVILTEWYAPPETPSERFKITVFIMDRALRADGVRVSVFRQVRDRSGAWVDAAVEQRTGREMEDTILTRARQLRIAATGGE